MAVERALQILSTTGATDREIPFSGRDIEIGREGSGIACPDDVEMANRQARVAVEGDGVRIHQLGEGSGIWLRVDGQRGRLLRSGDQIWLGSQILVVRLKDDAWQIRHHGPDGRLREVHALQGDGLFVGRASELALDLDDSRLSRRHAQLVLEGHDLRLYDRSAHNGTWCRVVRDELLSDGDEFRISTNRFRLVEREISMPDDDSGGAGPKGRSEAPTQEPRRARGLAARLRRLGSARREESSADDASESRTESHDPSIAETRVETSSTESTGKALVVIDAGSESVSIEVEAGRTILEAVREAGLERGEPVDWECGDGGCGVCVLGVVEGADRLDPPDPSTGEMKTIQITEQVVPDPNKYRLACLARVRGTVRLRKLT